MNKFSDKVFLWFDFQAKAGTIKAVLLWHDRNQEYGAARPPQRLPGPGQPHHRGAEQLSPHRTEAAGIS